MDFEMISCGVAGQKATIPAAKIEQAKQKISEEIRRLLQDGYRRFLIAITGEAALLFAEAVLSFREQSPDAGIDVLLPFDGWIEQQTNCARYKQITAQAESANYSCDEEYEDSVDICNQQLIGFGRCMVVIHDGELVELIGDARDADQEVKEILI